MDAEIIWNNERTSWKEALFRGSFQGPCWSPCKTKSPRCQSNGEDCREWRHWHTRSFGTPGAYVSKLLGLIWQEICSSFGFVCGLAILPHCVVAILPASLSSWLRSPAQCMTTPLMSLISSTFHYPNWDRQHPWGKLTWPCWCLKPPLRLLRKTDPKAHSWNQSKAPPAQAESHELKSEASWTLANECQSAAPAHFGVPKPKARSKLIQSHRAKGVGRSQPVTHSCCFRHWIVAGVFDI